MLVGQPVVLIKGGRDEITVCEMNESLDHEYDKADTD